MYSFTEMTHILNNNFCIYDSEVPIVNKEYVFFSSIFNLKANKYNSEFTNFKGIRDHYDRAYSSRDKVALYKVDNIKFVEDEVRAWIDDIPTIFQWTDYSTLTRGTGLDRAVSAQLFWRRHTINYSNYFSGYYSLIKPIYNSDKIVGFNPYFILMLKKQFLKEVKLSILLGQEVYQDCFELWYDPKLIESLDDSSSIKKGFNNIKRQMTEWEIPCIDIVDIMQEFTLKCTESFKAPTITKHKELVADFAVKFRKSERREI